MKKLLSLTVLGLSLFTLAACGKSSSKTETKGSLDNEASKILTVKHGNVRQNFDKITMANASQEFSGGSNLDSLKGWFGDPHQRVRSRQEMLSLMFIIGSMTMLLLQRNSLTIALLLSQFQTFLTSVILKSH